MNKRILALVLTLMLVLSSFTAFADNMDLKHKVTGDDVLLDDILFDDDVFFDVIENLDKYYIEWNGKYYDLEEVQAKFTANPGITMAEAVEGLIPWEAPEDPDPADPEAPVPGTYEIVLTTEDEELVGDGKSNTTVHVEFRDAATNAREKINGLQVRLTTTYGQLSDQVVTLQNGYGHTTLNSEAVEKDNIVVYLNGQVIEGTVPVDYKRNIAGMTAQEEIVFTTPEDLNKLQEIPRLLKAESNQADRVTLWFDRAVDPEDFVTESDALVFQHDRKGLFGIGLRRVIGFYREEGNDDHSLQAILDVALDEEDGVRNDVLTDNKNVYVSLMLTRDGNTLVSGNLHNILNRFIDEDNEFIFPEDEDPIDIAHFIFNNVMGTNFILTDNRIPEVTEIEHDGNMRQLAVYFSEAIESAQFSLDGGTKTINNVTYGSWIDYDTDERHIVTLDIEYLAPGEHTLQISAPKDFAYATDTENIGTTQELRFTVLDNTLAPTAKVIIESPEQFRIFLENADATVRDLQDIELQMLTPGGWVEIFVRVADTNNYPNHSQQRYMGRLADGSHARDMKLAWVTQHGDELVVETNTDWTYVFETLATEDNYFNYKYRIVIPEDTFMNLDNGLENGDLILDLEGITDPRSVTSGLYGYQDYKSPKNEKIKEINPALGEFDLLYNEPIKAIGIEEDAVGETPSESQHRNSQGLPNIGVRYRGTLNGVTKEVGGFAEQYVSENGKDIEIRVKADRSLLGLVDGQCYDEDWVLIVENVTDDVGNSAVTINHPFTVPATKADKRKFQIAEAELMTTTSGINVRLPSGSPALDIENYDIVRVEYTDFIRIAGHDDSATNKSNYKLNGRDLGKDSFVLVDLDSEWEGRAQCLCRYEVDGYNAVYIFTPSGSIINTQGNMDDQMAGRANTLEVNQRLMSKDLNTKDTVWNAGVKLTAPYQVELDYYSGWDGFGNCIDQVDDQDDDPVTP